MKYLKSCGLMLLMTFAGCAGYQIGHNTLYRPDIRTVYVPVFESESLRRYLGERLTEAVIKEIEMRTPYKVVSVDGFPDSTLTGRITAETKRVKSESRNDDARDLETVFNVEVQWIGRNGEMLMQRSAIPLPIAGLDLSVERNFIPQSGQSLTTAQQQVIERLARDIVSQMETIW